MDKQGGFFFFVLVVGCQNIDLSEGKVALFQDSSLGIAIFVQRISQNSPSVELLCAIDQFVCFMWKRHGNFTTGILICCGEAGCGG